LEELGTLVGSEYASCSSFGLKPPAIGAFTSTLGEPAATSLACLTAFAWRSACVSEEGTSRSSRQLAEPWWGVLHTFWAVYAECDTVAEAVEQSISASEPVASSDSATVATVRLV
jgi:hypothetical protein